MLRLWNCRCENVKTDNSSLSIFTDTSLLDLMSNDENHCVWFFNANSSSLLKCRELSGKPILFKSWLKRGSALSDAGIQCSYFNESKSASGSSNAFFKNRNASSKSP